MGRIRFLTSLVMYGRKRASEVGCIPKLGGPDRYLPCPSLCPGTETFETTVGFHLLLEVHVGGWRPAAAPPDFWHTWGSLRAPNSTSCAACQRTPPAGCSPWISVCNGTWYRSVGGWHDNEDIIMVNTGRRARSDRWSRGWPVDDWRRESIENETNNNSNLVGTEQSVRTSPGVGTQRPKYDGYNVIVTRTNYSNDRDME